MRLSRLFGTRHKERPGEAVLDSHIFLLRGGYARPVASGIFSMLSPGLRVLRKLERILREEMERVGAQEVLFPAVLPRELWEAAGRTAATDGELFLFNDRAGRDMVLAMTHEEAATQLARTELQSHVQLPLVLYQIQAKFRDEANAGGGLVRCREFTMKDAYSFHADQADLEFFYSKMAEAYHRIFVRVGLPETIMAESGSGIMGGSIAHEFAWLTEFGDEKLALCNACGYAANVDVARVNVPPFVAAPCPLEKVHTPGAKTIEDVAAFLGVETRQTAKAVFYESDREGCVVHAIVRGDRLVSESKLARIIGTMPVAASEDRIRSIGGEPGYASPLGINLECCRLIVDHTVAASNNLVTGANEPDYHYMNFNLERDLPGIETVDVLEACDGDFCSQCGHGRLVLHSCFELANIFQLGDFYTAPMGVTFTDASGQTRTPVMGSYGIGLGRLMSIIMEAHHDAYGPKWPVAVAPWQVHLCALSLQTPVVRDAAEQLYCALENAGIEVVYDDRDMRPGVQFADADLLGVPFRLILAEKNLAQGRVEWKRRDTGEIGLLPVEDAADTLVRRVTAALNSSYVPME